MAEAIASGSVILALTNADLAKRAKAIAAGIAKNAAAAVASAIVNASETRACIKNLAANRAKAIAGGIVRNAEGDNYGAPGSFAAKG